MQSVVSFFMNTVIQKCNWLTTTSSPYCIFRQARCPSPSSAINEISDIYYTPVRNDDISWNFEKILLDHKGQPWKRYTSAVEPEDLVRDIEELINRCQ